MTRGGPSMGIPLGWRLDGFAAKQHRLEHGMVRDHDWPLERVRRPYADDHALAVARPTPSLQFTISPEYADENGTSSTFNGPINRQYLTTQGGGRPRPTASATSSALSIARRCHRSFA
jgi:hypothetical protein